MRMYWSLRRDLNPGPSAYKANALTSRLRRQFVHWFIVSVVKIKLFGFCGRVRNVDWRFILYFTFQIAECRDYGCGNLFCTRVWGELIRDLAVCMTREIGRAHV